MVGVAIGDVDAVDAHDPVAAAQPDTLGVRATLDASYRHRRRAADREAVALGAALDYNLKHVRQCRFNVMTSLTCRVRRRLRGNVDLVLNVKYTEHADTQDANGHVYVLVHHVNIADVYMYVRNCTSALFWYRRDSNT